MELFDHMEAFDKFECSVYGKTEEVFALAINLLWRSTGDLVRFVLANTSRGPIVPMCNDLQIAAETAIRLYCARTRIEIAFDMLKNLIGAFRYRFWSKGLPRHCRKPKKNAKLKGPSKNNVEKVKKCWTAIERFTMIGAKDRTQPKTLQNRRRSRSFRICDALRFRRERQARFQFGGGLLSGSGVQGILQDGRFQGNRLYLRGCRKIVSQNYRFAEPRPTSANRPDSVPDSSGIDGEGRRANNRSVEGEDGALPA